MCICMHHRFTVNSDFVDANHRLSSDTIDAKTAIERRDCSSLDPEVDFGIMKHRNDYSELAHSEPFKGAFKIQTKPPPGQPEAHRRGAPPISGRSPWWQSCTEEPEQSTLTLQSTSLQEQLQWGSLQLIHSTQNPAIYSKYKSTLNAFDHDSTGERFMGLYKGVVSPLSPPLTQVGLAGTGCGIVTSLIASPTELIKIRQQNVLVNDPSNASATKVAMAIFRQHGSKDYIGVMDRTSLRHMNKYEATCRYFKPYSAPSVNADHSLLLSKIDAEAHSTPWSVLFLAGGFAGIAGWLATFPMDLVKTRMQSTEPSVTMPNNVGYPRDPFRTMLSTVVHSYRTEGPSVFFRGLAPTLIRSVLHAKDYLPPPGNVVDPIFQARYQ
ncbi:mitochondrial carrier domain-containing protein [Melanogaster broomeanus]|nr:mitochondrial carrier domain-containing protein [Melanogaster broomeanus]